MNSKIKILLLDDSPNFLERVKLNLPSDFFDVTTAINGEIGLEKFRKAKGIDVVITDFHMPIIKGDEVCRQIRKQNPKMKIILWTDNLKQIDALSFKPEADVILDKLDNFKDIQKIIKSLIESKNL